MEVFLMACHLYGNIAGLESRRAPLTPAQVTAAKLIEKGEYHSLPPCERDAKFIMRVNKGRYWGTVCDCVSSPDPGGDMVLGPVYEVPLGPARPYRKN
jgi:hypothetical protein